MRKSFNDNEQTLKVWHDENLNELSNGAFEEFAGELERVKSARVVWSIAPIASANSSEQMSADERFWKENLRE